MNEHADRIEQLENRIMADIDQKLEGMNIKVELIFGQIREMRGSDRIPNYFKQMSLWPEMLEKNWQDITRILGSNLLNNLFKEIVVYTLSHKNNCEYCAMAHKFAVLGLNEGLSESQLEDYVLHNTAIAQLSDREQVSLDLIKQYVPLKRSLTPDLAQKLLKLGYSQNQVNEIQELIDLTYFMNQFAKENQIEIDREYLVS